MQGRADSGVLGTYGRDEYFFHHRQAAVWPTYTNEKIRQMRIDLVEHVRDINPIIVPTSRGILMSAAHGPSVERLKVSLDMLRHVVKSKLPVEVYYFDGEGLDNPVLQEEMSGYGVDFISVGPKRGSGFSELSSIALTRHQTSSVSTNSIHSIRMARLGQSTPSRSQHSIRKLRIQAIWTRVLDRSRKGPSRQCRMEGAGQAVRRLAVASRDGTDAV